MTEDVPHPFCDPNEAYPIVDQPLAVSVVDNEVVLTLPAINSLTADAAEATGHRLIAAAQRLRSTLH